MIRAILTVDETDGQTSFHFFQRSETSENYIQVGCINDGEFLPSDFGAKYESELRKLSSNNDTTTYCFNCSADSKTVIIIDMPISREKLAEIFDKEEDKIEWDKQALELVYPL